MPYHGLSSFLQLPKLPTEIPKYPFQCPTSGFLLFYKYSMYQKEKDMVVSMPYLGFSSFLPLCALEKRNLISVSMPYLGLSSFLQKKKSAETNIETCFNALPRAFFFSTLLSLIAPSSHKIVSMPYLGLSSFLHIKNRINYETRKLFQCPTSGFLLFYIQHESDMPEFIRFQCPTTGFLLFYH